MYKEYTPKQVNIYFAHVSPSPENSNRKKYEMKDTFSLLCTNFAMKVTHCLPLYFFFFFFAIKHQISLFEF